MEKNEILTILGKMYQLKNAEIELLREGGTTTFKVNAENKKYFLKVAGAAFADTIQTAADINLYLQEKNFCVPVLIRTKDQEAYVEHDHNFILLYEFLETTEIDMDQDAREAGTLIGELHQCMKGYQGKLICRDKHFYLDRYLDQMRKKEYPKVEEFAQYGEKLWKRIKDLPQGYSHGDLYCGNIERGADGKLYVLDLDTSCIGFRMYDLALICNKTDYFNYDKDRYQKTTEIYEQFLLEYLKHCELTQQEIDSLYDMIALYHFALQATMIEIYGLDCVDEAFLNRQLDWLRRWEQEGKK